MVSIAALGCRDPGWFAVSNSNQKLSFHKLNNTSMLYTRKYRNPAIGGIFVNRYFSCNIDGLVHQYEEIWSRSMWQDRSHCSAGIFELSRLVLCLF